MSFTVTSRSHETKNDTDGTLFDVADFATQAEALAAVWNAVTENIAADVAQEGTTFMSALQDADLADGQPRLAGELRKVTGMRPTGYVTYWVWQSHQSRIVG